MQYEIIVWILFEIFNIRKCTYAYCIVLRAKSNYRVNSIRLKKIIANSTATSGSQSYNKIICANSTWKIVETILEIRTCTRIVAVPEKCTAGGDGRKNISANACSSSTYCVGNNEISRIWRVVLELRDKNFARVVKRHGGQQVFINTETICRRFRDFANGMGGQRVYMHTSTRWPAAGRLLMKSDVRRLLTGRFRTTR